jgi:hypothetical protein
MNLYLKNVSFIQFNQSVIALSNCLNCRNFLFAQEIVLDKLFSARLFMSEQPSIDSISIQSSSFRETSNLYLRGANLNGCNFSRNLEISFGVLKNGEMKNLRFENNSGLTLSYIGANIGKCLIESSYFIDNNRLKINQANISSCFFSRNFDININLHQYALLENSTFEENIVFDSLIIQSTPFSITKLNRITIFTQKTSDLSNIYTIGLLARSASLLVEKSLFFNLFASGCIYSSISNEIILRDSLFSQNSAVFSSGGAIFIGALSRLIIVNSSISAFTSLFNGGILFMDTLSNATVYNSSFLNSRSDIKGGSVFISEGCRFIAENASFRNSASNIGGIFYLQKGSFLSLRSSILQNGLAFREGGAFYVSEDTFLDIRNSYFLRNAAFDGGVFYLNEKLRNYSIWNSSFVSNSAVSCGGVIFSNIGSLLNLSSNIFKESTAALGGVIYSRSGFKYILLGNIFVNNSAYVLSGSDCFHISGLGGVAFILSNSSEIIYSEISNNLFSYNTGERCGGVFGILESVNESFLVQIRRFGVYEGNRGRYGADFGTSIKKLTAYFADNSHPSLYIGDPLVMYLQIKDYFDQIVDIGACSIKMISQPVIDLGSSSVKLNLNPGSFDSLSVDLNGTYALEYRFIYQEAVPVFPNVDLELTYTVWIELEQFGRVYVSNSLNVSIRLCRFGYVLEADPVEIYKCVPCLAGAFVNSSSEYPAICSKCPVGRFSNERSSSCLNCQVGKFSSNSGQADSCISCPLGLYSNSNEQSSCKSCESGRYSVRSGISVCSLCPGKFTTMQSKSIQRMSCVCPSGTFGIITKDDDCLPCPKYAGLKCDSNSSVPFVEQGFWRTANDIVRVHQCIPLKSCPSSGYSAETICSEGYRGKRCGDCIFNHFRSNQDCVECQYNWIPITVFVLISLAFLSFFAFSLLTNNLHENGRFPIRSILASIQTLGVLSRFSESFHDSATLSTVLSLADISNFNFGVFFAFECIVREFSFWDSFTLKTVLIIIVFSFIFLVGMFFTFLKSRIKSLRLKLVANPLDKSIAAFLMLLTSLYTFVLSSILSAFRCFPQGDGSYTLIPSPSLDCYDSIWYDHLGIIAIAIVLICIIPIGLFAILFLNRNQRTNNRVYWRFGRIIEPYKPNFYYWEVVVLIRKTIFVCLVDLTNGWQKLNRSFIIIAYLLIESFMDNLLKPFAENQGTIFKLRTM